MGSVTAADLVVTLSIPLLQGLAGPVQIQGFATDEVTDIPSLKSAETMMGVDGILSAGFVFVPIPQTYALQADSASNAFFDAWWAQMQSTKSNYLALGMVKQPSISMKYIMNGGVLTGYKPMANAKRLLQPRSFEITWQNIVVAPD